jgi:hypothetical protein
MQCILYKKNFGIFFICTTNCYAFYMHSYVDKILFLQKVGVIGGKLCSPTTAAEWMLIPCEDQVMRHVEEGSA